MAYRENLERWIYTDGSSIDFHRGSPQFNEPDWKKWLTDGLDVPLQADIDKTFLLLKEFNNGMSYVKGKLARRWNMRSFRQPYIGISQHGISNAVCAYSTAECAPVLAIDKSFLEKSTTYNLQAMYRFNCEQMPIVSTIPQFYALIGVEEFHHAVYRHYKGRLPLLAPERTFSYEYLAQDHEYHAKIWQLYYAKEHDFHPKSIQSLRNIVVKLRCLRQILNER